jgi:hypothetical protein
VANFEWEKDPDTGDLVINLDGKERGRIPNPDQFKMDQRRSGGSIIELDDIKAEFERVLGCKADA